MAAAELFGFALPEKEREREIKFITSSNSKFTHTKAAALLPLALAH